MRRSDKNCKAFGMRRMEGGHTIRLQAGNRKRIKGEKRGEGGEDEVLEGADGGWGVVWQTCAWQT